VKGQKHQGVYCPGDRAHNTLLTFHAEFVAVGAGRGAASVAEYLHGGGDGACDPLTRNRGFELRWGKKERGEGPGSSPGTAPRYRAK